MAHVTGASTPEHSAASTPSELEVSSEKASRRRTGSRSLRIASATSLAIVLAATLIIIALALGLGLGLGLKKRSAAPPVTSGPVSSWTKGSSLPFVEIDQLVDPSQFVLSPGFDTHAPAQVREHSWDLTEIIAAPGGIARRMLVVNGLYPGPTIEANLGDTIRVHVTNRMSNVSAIHWHGQFQNGTNFMDGTYSVTECGIAPGTSFTYEWTVQNVGTYWWHAHSGAQYSDGLLGALILHGPNDTYGFRSSPSDLSRPTEHAYDGDLIMIVSDVYNLFSTDWISLYLNLQVGGGEGDEPTPDYGVVNGIGQANCDGTPDWQSCVQDGNAGRYYNATVQPNQRYRIRVINAGSLASFDFSVDSHPLSVIEVDGTTVAPTPAASISVEVAQRTSFIIETNQTAGAYWIRATISDEMLAYDTPTIVKDQRAILRYTGVSESTLPAADQDAPALPASLPASVNTSALAPFDAIDPPAPTMESIVYINFGSAANGEFHAYFNNTAFGVPFAGFNSLIVTQNASTSNAQASYDGQFVVEVGKIEVLDIVINNQDDGGHPMHLHGYAPFLLGTGDGTYVPGKSLNTSQSFTNPMRRDVFVVPAYSWAVIRVITDNPGMWVLHCHLSSHMSAGLMMQFAVQPSKIAQFRLPDDYRSQCAALRKSGLVAVA